jgi:hypothetical protein
MCNLGCCIPNQEEIISMFNAPDIISTIKRKRIEWPGHIQRMARERCVKRIFEDKPGGRWREGRPRLMGGWCRK